jgi:hypothetical protein
MQLFLCCSLLWTFFRFSVGLDLSQLRSSVHCGDTADACELTDVALYRGALHLFGAEQRQDLYKYAACGNATSSFSLQWHANAARRAECARYEPNVLFVLDDLLAVLQNASRSTVHTSIRASNAFRLHNEFILPLFHAVSNAQRLQRTSQAEHHQAPKAFIFVPLCDARWWSMLLGTADRFHPDRQHLHHDHHVASVAQNKLEMPTTPGSILVRDQLHRLLSGLRRLSPPSNASVFDSGKASLQAASDAHMQCLSHVHWGRSQPPFGRNRPAKEVAWVAEYKSFIWSLYDLDVSSWKIGRPIAMRHLRDGDPFNLDPGGHHLDDDLHVALGFREHHGADVVAAQALAAAAVRVVHDDAAQRPAARRCVGCPAFEGTDAWCRCCSLNCGGFRADCEKAGFCRNRCVGSRWCDAPSTPEPPPPPVAHAHSKRDLVRDHVSADQKPVIMLLSGSDRSLHLASSNILQLSQLAAKAGFDFSLCCRTVYDHRELVRLVYNADVLLGFSAGGSLTNSVYMREDTLVVQLASPEEQFADDADKGTVAHMAQALKLRHLEIGDLTAPQITRQGLVYDLGALHTIINRVKLKWRSH